MTGRVWRVQARAVEAAGLGAEDFVVFKHGETRSIEKIQGVPAPAEDSAAATRSETETETETPRRAGKSTTV